MATFKLNKNNMNKILTTFTLEDLMKLKTEDLRENTTQHLIGDLIICRRDATAISSWVEDTQEEPDAYPDYNTDDLTSFLLSLKIIW